MKGKIIYLAIDPRDDSNIYAKTHLDYSGEGEYFERMVCDEENTYVEYKKYLLIELED